MSRFSSLFRSLLPDDFFFDEEHRFTPGEVHDVMDSIYARGDRLMIWFILCHFAIALAQGFFYDTWLVTITVGVSAAAMFLISVRLAPRSFLTRCLAGVALQMFVALHIYQLHGMLEMHFYFFTACTMMIVYQDWRSMWPGTVLIIGQHALFAALHNGGVRLYFFQQTWVGLAPVGFHFGIALLEVAICSYWAFLFRHQTLSSAWQNPSLPRAPQVEQGHGAELAKLVAQLDEARGRAENATGAKSEFLAALSHEIRNSMNCVGGMTRLLLGTSLDPSQRDYARSIRDSADALLNIINDILDLSLIEAGKMAIQAIPFDLVSLVEEAGTLLAPRSAEKGLELAFRFAPGIPASLVGDPGRVRQIVLNLVSNAVKFTSQGHVLVEAECRERSASEVLVRISAQDTGIGISRARQSLLFETFDQGDTAITRQFGGTGLGLAVSRQLAVLMSGGMGVESQPGKGSTFWCDLRLGLAAEQPVKEPAAHLMGARVMVAGCHPIQEKAIGECLARWAVRHDSAASGAELLDQLSTARLAGDPYRAVLVDSQLAGIETEELARIDGAGVGIKPPAVILISSLNEALPEMEASGFAGRLVKPVRIAALRDVLSKAMAAQRDPGEDNAAESVVPAAPQWCRVLVAEDDPVNQQVAALTLRQMGCYVDVVGNGREAVERWETLHYDAVLMDCEMPEMDGYEATLRIREKETDGRRTAIIAVTGNAMQEERERCFRVGMDDYIAKPVRAEELDAAIQRWAQHPSLCTVSGDAFPDY